jgi:putative transposase
MKISKKARKSAPGQQRLPWDQWEVPEEIHAVAEKFVLANCWNPDYAREQFLSDQGIFDPPVPGNENPES